MKKIMTILMCCAFVLCVGSAVMAEDDDIAKRHNGWIKKVAGAKQDWQIMKPQRDMLLRKNTDRDKQHTIAITFSVPTSKDDVKTLNVGGFTLSLANVVNQHSELGDIYVYMFSGDPQELVSIISGIVNPPPPIGGYGDGPKTPIMPIYTPIDPTWEVVKMPDVTNITDGGCVILPRSKLKPSEYAKHISGYNIGGDFLLMLSTGTQLQDILKNYDVRLLEKLPYNSCWLKAEDPLAAARIMNDVLKNGLAEAVGFNSICWATTTPIVDSKSDEKIAVEQEITLRFGDKRFTGQMAGEPKEVVPLQQKN